MLLRCSEVAGVLLVFQLAFSFASLYIVGYAEFHGLLLNFVRYLAASMFHLSLMDVIPVSIWINGIGVDLKQPRIVRNI